MRPKIDPLNPNSPGFGQRLQESAQRDFDAFQQNYDQVMTSRDNFPANSRIDSEVSGDLLTGPPPRHTSQGMQDLISSREQWGEDPYAYGKPFSFGAGERALNFERYYSHPAFKRLGFDPHVDNEAVYNRNTGWLSDFQRAVPYMLKNAGLGIRDMFTEWTDFGNRPDVEHAQEMQRNMMMGNTTRSGLGGWITNFTVNMGYTMGVMAELAMEELALAGLTAAAGGFNLPATSAAATARAVAAGQKIGSAAKATREWANAFRAIRTPEQATSFYKAVKSTGQFLNPFERTTGFIGELTKLKGMSNYAKASRGAMAFFGDLRMMNAVSSESKLEGGMTKIDTNRDLVNDFYEKWGRLPRGDEVKKINDISNRAALWTNLYNIPMIYLSNKIVLDGALHGTRVLRESAAETGFRTIAGETGQVLTNVHAFSPSELVSKWSRAGLKESFRPGNILKGTLRYTARNLTEGLQESSQDIIHNTLSDYYRKYYEDPTLASMKSSFGKGLISQVSAQGLDTFISGFLMGGALGAVQKPLFTTLPLLSKKIFTPNDKFDKDGNLVREGYNTWKAKKEEYVNNFVNIYNEIKKNPRKYMDAFDSTDENFVMQSLLKDYLIKSKGHEKETMDIKDESAFHHAYSMLENNQIQFLKDLIQDYKQMTPVQLQEAFGKESEPDNLKMDIKQRLDNFEKKVNIVDSLYKQHIKSHPNPISKEQASKSPEAFNFYHEFEMYRKIALFSHYSFQRAADRTSSILEDAQRNKPLDKAFSSDFSVLYSPLDLKDHLKALRQEISLLKGSTDPGTKAELKSKQDRLEALSNYNIILKGLQDAHKRSDTKLIAGLNDELHKAYKSYLTIIADDIGEPLLDENLDKSFINIRDFYTNNQDRVDMARAVNMFSDPQYIQELLTRLHQVKTTLDEDQVPSATKGLRDFIDKGAWNELFVQLFNLKILIPEDQVETLMSGKLPTRLLDATTEQFIPLDSDRGKEAIELIKLFFSRINEPVSPADVTPAPPSPPTVSQALDDKLRNAFTVENLRRAAEQEPKLYNYDDFVKHNSIALDIIADHNKTNIVGAEVVDETKPSPQKIPDTILDEFKGKIIYMTAGVGKTLSAGKHPEQLIDGDDLMLEFLQRKSIPNSGDSQKSGLDFWRYINSHPEQEAELTQQFQELAKESVADGKTLLTGSKYLRPIADRAFLTQDVTRVAKIFRERGQTRYTEAATKHIKENLEAFPSSEDIPEGIFTEQILTGTVPVPQPVDTNIQDRVNKTNTLDELDTLTKELLVEVTEGRIDGNTAQAAVTMRRQQLITEVSFERINKGDILVMTDKKFYKNKGLAEVVEKSDKDIKVRSWSASSTRLPKSVRVISADKINQDVELIYKEGMTDQDITPTITPSDEAIAKTNEQPTQDLKDKIKARKENKTHNGDDLFDKPDC